MKKYLLIKSMILFGVMLFVGCSNDSGETDSNPDSNLPTDVPTNETPTNGVAKFTVLHDFKISNSSNISSLTYSAGLIYGVANDGLYSIKTDGTAYKLLHTFPEYISPCGSPLIKDGVIYGMTTYGDGIYKLNIDGSGYKVLHNFSANNLNDALTPYGSLIIHGNTLYGMTKNGGTGKNSYLGSGTIFKIDTDGTNFKLLHSFTSNEDCFPYGSLLINNNVLYGMTSSRTGASSLGYGSIFKINMDGTNYTVLHKFTGGKDGGNSAGSLIANGNVLYGMTPIGGEIGSYTIGGNKYSRGGGNVFKINADGSGFTNLLEIKGGIWTNGWYGSLTLVRNVLYGISVNHLYSVNIDGSGYKNYDWSLWSGTFNSEITENGSLIFDGKSLYDVIRSGDRIGVLYKFDPPY